MSGNTLVRNQQPQAFFVQASEDQRGAFQRAEVLFYLGRGDEKDPVFEI